ncbi:MAG: hypothetical protein GY772_24620 [bacterium]|nr:hypothetical protein [bacterium]
MSAAGVDWTTEVLAAEARVAELRVHLLLAERRLTYCRRCLRAQAGLEEARRASPQGDSDDSSPSGEAGSVFGPISAAAPWSAPKPSPPRLPPLEEVIPVSPAVAAGTQFDGPAESAPVEETGGASEGAGPSEASPVCLPQLVHLVAPLPAPPPLAPSAAEAAAARKRPYQRTPAGECAACWRPAHGLRQGAAKHDPAKNCRKRRCAGGAPGVPQA